MSKETFFDFCIIPNPFASGDRHMVFITSASNNFLDKTIMMDEKYQDVREILAHFGYTETALLQFESSNNAEFSGPSHIRQVKNFLLNCGLAYSRELEVNIIRDLDNLKEEGDRAARGNSEFVYEDIELGKAPGGIIEENTRNRLIESKNDLFDFKYELPTIGECVTLYFYLFLEIVFDEIGKPSIQFSAGFSDTYDLDSKNYIRIIKSDFERVYDRRNPNSIILKSLKTQEDFIKESGMLYSGFFRYQRKILKSGEYGIQAKKFSYKIAEIKRFLDPEQSVVIHMARMGYDRLIELSSDIKKEKENEEKRVIATEDIKYEAEELKDFLTEKMIALSDAEEYEAAATMKKDVDLINEKISLVDSMKETEITAGKYFELFSLS